MSCNWVEDLKTKVDDGIKEILKDNDAKYEKLVKEIKQVAVHTGAKMCGVCDMVGHKGRDCPQLNPKNWCRICGSNYHVTKNCKEDKKCVRCGTAGHHATILHDETDPAKRMALIVEFGDMFSHFVQEMSAELKIID